MSILGVMKGYPRRDNSSCVPAISGALFFEASLHLQSFCSGLDSNLLPTLPNLLRLVGSSLGFITLNIPNLNEEAQ